MKYDDIINLPHHRSDRHPPLPRESRAAQFAPFAALTGHEEVISEAARITESHLEMSEEKKDNLAKKLNMALQLECLVVVTFFVPDAHKAGGRYEKKRGKISKIDELEKILIFTDKTSVSMKYVYEIEAKELENLGL